MSLKKLRNSARLEVLTEGLLKNLFVGDPKQLLWLLHHEIDGTMIFRKAGTTDMRPITTLQSTTDRIYDGGPIRL